MLGPIFKRKAPETKFWDWFIENEAALFYGTDDEDKRGEIFEGLTERIKAIDSNLAYAFSPIQSDDTKEFIISADGMKESFPNVEKLVSLAPKHNHWKFLAFRQPNPGNDLSLKISGIEIGYNDIYFRYLLEEGTLSVELNVRNYDGSGLYQTAVCILLDSLLGEYDTVMEIDYIDWEVLDEEKLENLYSFIELREVVEQKKRNTATNKT